MKLSPNFDSSEFIKSGVLNDELIYLLSSLCNNVLEPLRSFLNCSLIISSGVRSEEDYQRLINSGYNPSETSDHYYNNPVKILSDEKVKKWGEYYSAAVGAADIILAIGANAAWEKILPYFNKDNHSIDLPVPFLPVKVGQCIHEFGNGNDWIHVSNDPHIKFSDDFINKFLNRKCFMYSPDRGVTYIEV